MEMGSCPMVDRGLLRTSHSSTLGELELPYPDLESQRARNRLESKGVESETEGIGFQPAIEPKRQKTK
ncbi:hypothetical protein Ocin01_09757 [Orchesella cincta]|uniref:Uncharacterized protein n=1 Tax=Orchesella cincta TaxID=48709 RepID=A0A1D2MUZ6_ORCCI|nr:hypothetical protein Ocin01_09757 [Orchesella cincta]